MQADASYSNLEISKGVLLKSIQQRAKLRDLEAVNDIADALEDIGPLMAACRWDELLRRAVVLFHQTNGGGVPR